MSIKTCLKYGGFPEKYMNEDLTFGYILSSLKQPIYSIPYLEIADVPLSWKVFIKQKTVWFWNFLEYIRCYSHPSLKQVPKARRIALLIIGWSRAVYWFFSAFFFGLPLILGIVFLNFKVFLLGTFGFLCFSILPISFLYLYLPRTLEKQGLKSYAENLRSISFLKTAFWLPLIFLSDSIGPWIATWQWIIWKLANVLPDKPKTD
jgi:hypothetical protein